MEISDCTTRSLFDLSRTLATPYLRTFRYPWEALEGISRFIREYSAFHRENFVERGDGVLVHRTATVAPTAMLAGPCIIGAHAEVRHGAFIRGGVIVGCGCVVGNSVELKNCILFEGVQVPHFNYVGDSILGYKAHLGAGALLSNVKADRTNVEIAAGDRRVPTGRYKVGSFVGDHAEIGCNAVLCPGTVIGRDTTVYPLTMCRGAYPADSIVKGSEVIKKRTD